MSPSVVAGSKFEQVRGPRGQLWSLAHMHERMLTTILAAQNRIGRLEQWITCTPGEFKIRCSEMEELRAAVEELRAVCHDLDLTLSKIGCERLAQLIAELVTDVPSEAVLTTSDWQKHGLSAVCNDALQRLRDEMRTRHVLVIPQRAATYYAEGARLFGPHFLARFPNSSYDLDEAGKCLAFGRATATVFHSMKVVEAGLRAVHAHLGIQVVLEGQDRNWGKILGRIRDELRPRPTSTDKDELQAIYAFLDAVKDAWRNGTMHVENKYTEEEAASILQAVQSFMTKVANRMDENGKP